MLALTGTAFESLTSQMVLASALGLLTPPMFWAFAAACGLHLPVLVPLWASLLTGAAGAAIPIAKLRSSARAAHQQARRVLCAFLDLVVLGLAGGMGIEGALHEAAKIGDDPISVRIFSTLETARDAGEPPWDALSQLGDALGVPELDELAGAVGLAGTEGARIRTTLASKASSMRRRSLAEAESQANETTERLFLPGVFLLLGFLLFIGYPAFARIAGSF